MQTTVIFPKEAVQCASTAFLVILAIRFPTPVKPPPSRQASEPPQKKQKAALYGASVDDIYGPEKGELDQHFDKQEERRRGRRGLERKRGRRPGPRGLPAEVTKKLGQANLFYAMEQYQEVSVMLHFGSKLEGSKGMERKRDRRARPRRTAYGSSWRSSFTD